MTKPKGYADLSSFSEDDRIRTVGTYATANPGLILGIAVDDQLAKIERYRRKLLERFPRLEVLDVTRGSPIPNVATIRIRVTPS